MYLRGYIWLVVCAGSIPRRPFGAYRPILPAQRGELEALARLDPAMAPFVRPILQMRASGKGPAHDAGRFVDEIRERRPAGLHVGVDVAELPDDNTATAAVPRDIA